MSVYLSVCLSVRVQNLPFLAPTRKTKTLKSYTRRASCAVLLSSASAAASTVRPRRAAQPLHRHRRCPRRRPQHRRRRLCRCRPRRGLGAATSPLPLPPPPQRFVYASLPLSLLLLPPCRCRRYRRTRCRHRSAVAVIARAAAVAAAGLAASHLFRDRAQQAHGLLRSVLFVSTGAQRAATRGAKRRGQQYSLCLLLFIIAAQGWPRAGGP